LSNIAGHQIQPASRMLRRSVDAASIGEPFESLAVGDDSCLAHPEVLSDFASSGQDVR
jgi:hypothetical protein